MINAITQLLTESGMDIFYISAIIIYILFMGILITSTIVHQKDIQFFRIFMRKDKRPSRIAVTWLLILPVILYQSMTGDHEVTSGLVELVFGCFIAELAVQGINIAELRFGKFCGRAPIENKNEKPRYREEYSEDYDDYNKKRPSPKATLDEDM